MEDIEIENHILSVLSPVDPMWSNQVFGTLHVNKARFTKIKNKMISEEWISSEIKDGKQSLTKINFESPKFDSIDWTEPGRTNCETWLKYFKKNKPLFRIHKNKPFHIKKEQKMMLNAYFHELDRQMVVCTRLVNADALGLIRSSKAKFHQSKCIEFVHYYIKKLLSDHKEFKDEIKEYAQSQVRTVQFKI